MPNYNHNKTLHLSKSMFQKAKGIKRCPGCGGKKGAPLNSVCGDVNWCHH